MGFPSSLRRHSHTDEFLHGAAHGGKNTYGDCLGDAVGIGDDADGFACRVGGGPGGEVIADFDGVEEVESTDAAWVADF